MRFENEIKLFFGRDHRHNCRQNRGRLLFFLLEIDKLGWEATCLDGEPVVMTPGKIYANFRDEQYANPIKLPLPEKIDPQYKRIRANQWKLVDWEADGDLDVIVGIGVWDDYGWDDAWDEHGNWKNGPLHGYVYLVENVGGSQETRVKSQETRNKIQESRKN